MLATRFWPHAGRGARYRLDRRLLLTLISLAAIVLFTHAIAMFVLPQAPGRMAEPSAELIGRLPLWSWLVGLSLPIPLAGPQLALAIVLLSAARFAAYAAAIYLCWWRASEPWSLGVVIGCALLCFLISMCALPNVDRDIYNYILSGRVATLYHANPYRVAPDQFPADPFYRYASARYTDIPGDNKLPVWMLLNSFLAGRQGDDIVTTLLLYRAAFLLINAVNVALIVHIFDALKMPGRLAGVVLYAWNPIVITYGQSKVDTLMVLFLLLAVLALALSRRRAAVVALSLSVCVKLITLPLLALFLLWQLRAGRRRELFVSALLAALVAAAVYLPFWDGPDMIWMHIELLAATGGAGPVALGLALKAGFVLGLLWVGWKGQPSLRGVIWIWALVALLFSVFLSRLGFSWYLMTLIALVSLAKDWRMAAITLALSLVSFLLNAWDSASNDVVALPDLFALPRPALYALFMALVGLGVLAAAWRQRRIRTRRVLSSG
jgi:hypothetical protein